MKMVAMMEVEALASEMSWHPVGLLIWDWVPVLASLASNKPAVWQDTNHCHSGPQFATWCKGPAVLQPP